MAALVDYYGIGVVAGCVFLCVHVHLPESHRADIIIIYVYVKADNEDSSVQ